MVANAQVKASPVKLVHSIPLPDLKDGDFDHFTADVEGNRLFVTAEENSKVEVFDTKTNKLIHTIDGLKAPHSMLYRGDLKKLFVVDGGVGEVKIYDSDYKPAGSIKLKDDADSMAYDPSTKYMYVVNGRNEAVHILDRTSGEILASFGRPGHQLGNLIHGHTMAVDSQGNIYIAETDWGRRVQRFKPASK